MVRYTVGTHVLSASLFVMGACSYAYVCMLVCRLVWLISGLFVLQLVYLPVFSSSLYLCNCFCASGVRACPFVSLFHPCIAVYMPVYICVDALAFRAITSTDLHLHTQRHMNIKKKYSTPTLQTSLVLLAW